MSTTSVNPLSAGVQQLYNQGILPSSVSTDVLSKSSPSQLNQLARLTISNQQTSVLFSAYTDSASLSTTATNNALLQEINPLSNSDASSTDPLANAVSNALLAAGTHAANLFLAPATTTTGSKINVLG